MGSNLGPLVCSASALTVRLSRSGPCGRCGNTKASKNHNVDTCRVAPSRFHWNDTLRTLGVVPRQQQQQQQPSLVAQSQAFFAQQPLPLPQPQPGVLLPPWQPVPPQPSPQPPAPGPGPGPGQAAHLGQLPYGGGSYADFPPL